MKVLGKIYDFISGLMLAVFVFFVVLLVGTRLVGFSPYAVLSGSMEPKYPVGSLIYVRSVEIETVDVGDAVTFAMSDGTTYITHEVVEIAEENTVLYTKGVANDVRDVNPVTQSNLVGKAYFCIPYMGYISTVVTSPPWIYVAMGLVVLWFLMNCIVDDIRKKKNSTTDTK